MKIIIIIIILSLISPYSIFVSPNSIQIDIDEVNGNRQVDFINNSNFIERLTLFSPLGSRKTYLIDYDGDIVHSWKSDNLFSVSTYLLENGSLLRGCGRNPGFCNLFTLMNFLYGRVEMLDWNGNLIWNFTYSDRRHCLHNDIEPLPNGNMLMIVWEYKTRAEAINAGVNPNNLNFYGGILTDAIIEVKPNYPEGGDIVWEWHSWDHIIQDFNKTKNNYGNISKNPQLFDINCKSISHSLRTNIFHPVQSMDFFHLNSLDYNPYFDQILITSFGLNEIFIIDHSTTIEEAVGHSGGKYGRGGDMLYRWGNPTNYNYGDINDKKLFHAHDAQWIETGLPGEGNIIVFNNGNRRPDGNYSSVEEIIPPVDDNGNYKLNSDYTFAKGKVIWRYIANPKESFYSPLFSGIQRLQNGNTLICEGCNGRFFEVTQDEKIVWEYRNWRPIPVKDINSVFKINQYQQDYLGLKKLVE